MADAPLHVRGRVDGMGDLDDTGSYIGFAYFTHGAEHRFKVALPAAELLVAEIREALSLPERKEGDSIQDDGPAPATDGDSHPTVSPRAQQYGFAATALAHEAYLYWTRHRCEISEPDLDNEQPVHVTVSLGTLRAYRSHYAWVTAEPSQSGAESALELHTTSPPGAPNS